MDRLEEADATEECPPEHPANASPSPCSLADDPATWQIPALCSQGIINEEGLEENVSEAPQCKSLAGV